MFKTIFLITIFFCVQSFSEESGTDTITTIVVEQESDSAISENIAAQRNIQLFKVAKQLKSLAEIDTLSDVTEEERDFLRRRFKILHPLAK